MSRFLSQYQLRTKFKKLPFTQYVLSGALARLWAMICKEFIQMRRDKTTLGMMIGIPLIQLTLFGFAINLNPRHLPAAVVGIAIFRVEFW